MGCKRKNKPGPTTSWIKKDNGWTFRFQRRLQLPFLLFAFFFVKKIGAEHKNTIIIRIYRLNLLMESKCGRSIPQAPKKVNNPNVLGAIYPRPRRWLDQRQRSLQRNTNVSFLDAQRDFKKKPEWRRQKQEKRCFFLSYFVSYSFRLSRSSLIKAWRGKKEGWIGKEALFLSGCQ